MNDHENVPNATKGGTNSEIIGMLIFTAIGSLSISRFGFLFPIALPHDFSLAICVVAGAIGGILLFRSYPLAGLFGGAIAGITGFLGLTWYVPFRAATTLSSLEIVLVQIVASLPGVAIGLVIYFAYYKASPKSLNDG